MTLPYKLMKCLKSLFGRYFYYEKYWGLEVCCHVKWKSSISKISVRKAQRNVVHSFTLPVQTLQLGATPWVGRNMYFLTEHSDQSQKNGGTLYLKGKWWLRYLHKQYLTCAKLWCGQQTKPVLFSLQRKSRYLLWTSQ